MQSADLEVLQAAQGWLAQGRRVALATVVRTFGSAPRPELGQKSEEKDV